MSEYNPIPINTADVELPSELTGLVEKLAENSHDIWAEQRMREGWTHGVARDDAQKKHPCLIPYGDLPDSEREYDRLMAMGTFKLVLALGYRILPPPHADSQDWR